MCFYYFLQGQTESKRTLKIKGPQTKGTAMSFGFKKKSVATTNVHNKKPTTTQYSQEKEQKEALNAADSKQISDSNGNSSKL